MACLLTGGSVEELDEAGDPRIIAGQNNDGGVVFAISPRLSTAPADATYSRLSDIDAGFCDASPPSSMTAEVRREGVRRGQERAQRPTPLNQAPLDSGAAARWHWPVPGDGVVLITLRAAFFGGRTFDP